MGDDKNDTKKANITISIKLIIKQQIISELLASQLMILYVKSSFKDTHKYTLESEKTPQNSNISPVKDFSGNHTLYIYFYIACMKETLKIKENDLFLPNSKHTLLLRQARI